MTNANHASKCSNKYSANDHSGNGYSRRRVLTTGLALGGLTAFQMTLPAWARSAAHGNRGIQALTGNRFDLNIGKFPVSIGGKTGMAIGVNGTLPAPLIRFREGETITLNVTNGLDVDSSIHWHGLLVPFPMDGVPGVSFPGIKPGQTFKYEFSIPHSGTYWYHSHSGLQEQSGHYGPIIIDPAGTDPVQYDREHVVVLSDWSFMNPHKIFNKLKTMGESMNMQKTTLSNGDRGRIEDPAMWGRMRMSPTDIADVTGATYTYLINGHATADNWNAVYKSGERVRLRIINASAMTIFNFRIPGLPMTVVASDGLNVQPLETDEFQIGVAETYDVIVEPSGDTAFAIVAESIDRSGQVVATLAPHPDMKAKEPQIRERPLLTMKDMGMDHSNMDMSGDDMSDVDPKMDPQMDPQMDHSKMDHSKMGHAPAPKPEMDHSKMDHGSMNIGSMDMGATKMGNADASVVKRGPGVANIAMMPSSRLDEPGIGLANVPHRVLTYAQLRSLNPTADKRAPGREIDLHLTSNMERYMWSFNGVKFAHVKEAIKFYEGERVRLNLTNDTMMTHPIHLHGMFFDVQNGGGDHLPRKHTINVKPGEKLSVDVTADNIGDWAFHCHLLYHMHAGMMQVVSVLPKSATPDKMGHDKIKPKMDPKMDPDMDHSKMDHSKMGHE